MTDNNQLGKIKKKYKDQYDNDLLFEYEEDEMNWLIQEVERLNRVYTEAHSLIESLTKERDQLRALINKSIDNVEKTSANIMESISNSKKLEAENAELKEKYHNTFDELGGERIQVAGLKKELAELKKKVEGLWPEYGPCVNCGRNPTNRIHRAECRGR